MSTKQKQTNEKPNQTKPKKCTAEDKYDDGCGTHGSKGMSHIFKELRISEGDRHAIYYILYLAKKK